MRFSNTVLEKTRKFLAQCYVHDLRNSVDAIAPLALLLARKKAKLFFHLEGQRRNIWILSLI